MNNIEVEFRTEIPFNDFEKIKGKLGSIAQLSSHKRRFSVMLFMGNDNTSILYIRTTKDVNSGIDDTEIIHKKGIPASYDRIELTQKINVSDFESYIEILGSLPANKVLIMQRETINFVTPNSITVSLVRAKKHAYLEFEKLTSVESKEIASNEVLKLMNDLEFNILDEDGSRELFKRLDGNDDRVVLGKPIEIDSIVNDYQEFLQLYSGRII